MRIRLLGKPRALENLVHLCCSEPIFNSLPLAVEDKQLGRIQYITSPIEPRLNASYLGDRQHGLPTIFSGIYSVGITCIS